MKTPFAVLAASIALTGMLLLPACASRKDAADPLKIQDQIAEYRKQEVDLVQSTVSDPERASQLIKLLAERDQLVAENSKAIAEYHKRMLALNADYDATRESIDALAADYNNDRKIMQEKYLTLIVAMKKETTAKEWKVISKFQLKRLDPRKLSYGQPVAGG